MSSFYGVKRGGISDGTLHEVYTGPYMIDIDAFEQNILKTANKLLTKNITINPISYYEIENEKGIEIHIGEGSGN